MTALRFVAALGLFGFHAQSLLPRWPVLAPLIAGGLTVVPFALLI